MRRHIKLILGLFLLLSLIWVPVSSTEATAQSQTTVIPQAYRGSWFQPEFLQYRVKMTATTFTFGGGYYEHEHWQPHNQVTYRLSFHVTAGTFTWGKRNARGYHSVKVQGGIFYVKENRGTLFVKQIRQGHDINGYDLTFNQIPHAAQVLSGDVH
ncbi:hypothetical protein ADT67_10390 [Levilactobacillus brevis]|nr:hypothetical protein [Levilactobacillus brevis]AJA80821.1 hypothetical protein L747_04310 [Levilactobacillus brevis BSO 464]ATU69365.1 hypothetical protein CT113_03045 [Levilactobacillus brevis]OLF66598.1 hypothetical protein ADT67_10390 [Levilactobacillus brevis]QCZ48214.1 hypothetical protein UCCLB95_0959 [Levilactobacillus brevis]